MNKPAFLFLALLVGLPAHAQWQYPATKTVNASDNYFGRTYQDPYRWLEDLKDNDAQKWFKDQAVLTDGVLDSIPGRAALVSEWTDLDKLKPAKYGGIVIENGRVFYKKRVGAETIAKLYLRESWNGAEKLLFDPATYKQGTTTVVQSMVPSFDGKFVAMGLSANGAEFSEIRILEVATGKFLAETTYPSYGPIGWTLDSKSLFYDAGTSTDIKSHDIELNRQTRLHKLGTDFATDVDIFSNASYPGLGITAKEFPQASISEVSPEYLLGQVSTVQNEMRVFLTSSPLLYQGW